MRSAFFMIVACAVLAGCGTPIKYLPAANAGLAAKGWESAADPVPIEGFGLTLDRSLICKNPACGSNALYARGGGPLLAVTPFGAAITRMLNDPSRDSAWLRSELARSSGGYRAQQPVIEDIQKVGGEIRIRAHGSVSFRDGSPGYVLMHVTATRSAVRIEATAGENRGAAEKLFGMASLVR